MRTLVVLLSAAVWLGACASAPKGPEPLSDEQFKAAMEATKAPSNLPGGDDFARVRALTALIDRPELTPEQRIEALYMRAVLKGTTAEDRTGAIADYQTVIETAPAGHRLIERAKENKAYAETQMGHINRRLAQGPAGQTSQYFQDLLAAGRHDEAAQFFRDGKGSSVYAVEKLHKLGYLCEGPGYSGPSYTWGYGNTRQVAVQWCDTKAGQ